MSKVYLLAYNVAQTVAWSLCLSVVLTAAFVERATPSEAFAKMGYLMWVAQNAAILEVFHAIVKLVPSPVASTSKKKKKKNSQSKHRLLTLVN
jgi:hypothetical protein